MSYREVEVPSLGGFLLVAGSEEALAPCRAVQNTVLVDDLDGLHALPAEHGGKIVEIVEYVEHTV
ncbi:hypothetical protein [Streptomyces roseochromogenus]|uniref:Uncharacterized protein n=1 Tax=Streptomyces roseochromogenus subsp. oscitans DS 12.976 TaxID=1352936 RepID=V6JM65_STRRC|nr:hypothetical protein [Streptomyces roseochromogenus]EST20171.1 hypothetical protein M878_40090 [Streptomyces roseochromogenus subsp. oscitans DS 12.976]